MRSLYLRILLPSLEYLKTQDDMKSDTLRNKYFKYMHKSVLIILIAFFCNSVTAQKSINALSIGDTIPEALWKTTLQVVNHPTGKETVSLEEYRGKLIILDFWGTYCSSCIAAFPKLKAIQEDNIDRLKILAVSSETKEQLNGFFNSERGDQYSFINSVYADELLLNYFPHRSVPHIIWITPDGEYYSSTNSKEITQAHVDAILNNDEAKLRVKVDMDKTKPLFLTENFYLIDDLKLPYYSIFVQGYYPGFPSGNNFRRNDQKKVYGRQVTNRTLFSILSMVANNIFEEKGEKFDDKRLIIETENPILSYRDHRILDGSIGVDEYFSLELIVPENKADSLYTYMLQDLNRYLDLNLRVERREVECMTLVRTSNIDKIKTKGGKPNEVLSESEHDYSMSNIPFGNLLTIINETLPTILPIIDDTGYHKNVDIKLFGLNDLAQLRNSLKQYDLDLVESKRELLMFVIEDK